MGRDLAFPLFWGLPVLAFGLGSIACLTVVLSRNCACAPPSPWVLPAGLYFASFGFVALVARWRGAIRLAEVALFALVFALMGAGLALQVNGLVALKRPLTPMSGQLSAVSAGHGSKGVGGHATFVFADGRQASWSCGAFDCRDRIEALASLRRDTPMPVEMLVAKDQVVGLTANGVQMLDAEREQARQFGARAGWTIFLALSMAALTSFGYFRWRKAKPGYTRPSPVDPPKLWRPRP